MGDIDLEDVLEGEIKVLTSSSSYEARLVWIGLRCITLILLLDLERGTAAAVDLDADDSWRPAPAKRRNDNPTFIFWVNY